MTTPTMSAAVLMSMTHQAQPSRFCSSCRSSHPQLLLKHIGSGGRTIIIKSIPFTTLTMTNTIKEIHH